MQQILTTVYTLGFLALALYGVKVVVLVAGYLWVRRRVEAPTGHGELPVVTVQVPVFNERHVANRVIDAVCRLHWPRDRFEVQVLDDSTDLTCAVVDAAVEAWRERGVDVKAVRRPDRGGYKAGALAHATPLARGDVLAVFDADFVPHPDFLERTVPFLGPGVAAVQARWAHINPDQSWLTRVQALVLDGHFVVEQTARARNGLFFNFNGTAGVWCRAAIDAAGGWQGDTLSEDIDLSYRAQLCGWRLVYLPDVAVPAELPGTHLAFKRQQRRWSKGTTQLMRKLAARVWAAPRPLGVRLHGVMTLAEHLLHPVTVALILASPLLVVYRPHLPTALAALWLMALAPLAMYGLAAAALHRDWPRRLLVFPLAALLSVGLCVSGTVAVMEALFGRGGAFERTPKAGDPGATDSDAHARLRTSGYALRLDKVVLAEVVLACYCWVGLALAVRRDALGWAPMYLLFALGLSLSAGASLHDGMAHRAAAWVRHRPRRSRGGAAA